MAGLRYVYAVCRPFDTPLQVQLTGVAGAPARLLHHHGLVAVVSTVSEVDFAEEPLQTHLADPDWLARMARGHRQVVDALTVVTTPLPLWPATVVADDSEVRVMIEEREDRFRDILDRLRDRVEWGVTVSVPGASATGTTPPGGGAEGGPDARRAAVEARRAAQAFAERLHADLAGHAEAARRNLPHPLAPPLTRPDDFAPQVLNAAYLVPRTESEQFVEIVDRAAKDEESGTRVDLAGPWAAYSFVESEGQT
ncbi:MULTISPECIES: GvpL/GvpF family gas vesicle protein [unclassified Streptomyces]|uniref:GvpL/GvpF family gas vesicle protein n=1 Tax=unclassified Streptomyces TaxID=2593676 RepID=UPI003D70A54C